MSKIYQTLRKYGFSFSKPDGLHAALSVIPSVILILFGEVALGLAFTVGTLPTNQLGIAPKRKQRIIFGLIGSIFGLGVLIGSNIALIDSGWLVGLIFFLIAFISAVVASRRKVGTILLALFLPALAVGLGFSIETGITMCIAFILGSLWSSFVTLFWPEFDVKEVKTRNNPFVSTMPKFYGTMLGLSAVTALIFAYNVSPEFLGWTVAATLLVMRPLSGMVKNRGFWRATSTFIGGVFAIIAISLQLPHFITAALVLAIMVLIVGTGKSDWWLTPLGTAFFVLSLSLIGETDPDVIKSTGAMRILDNMVGALIAILFGLVIPSIFIRLKIIKNEAPSIQK